MERRPDFDENGNLPPNPDYWWATLAEIREWFAYTKQRSMLFGYLLKLAKILKEGGCKTLYLDGGFITISERPKDYDCCFDRTGVNDATKKLVFGYPGDPDSIEAYVKETFKADIFYSDEQYDFDSKTRKVITYLDFFQKKDGIPKGIIAIDLTKENL